MTNRELKFYDLTTKSFIISKDYQIVTKTTKRGLQTFAITKGLKGNKIWKIMPKNV